MADATTLSHSDIVLLVVCWSQQRKGGYGCEPFVFVEWRQGSHVAVLLSDRLLCRTREGSAAKLWVLVNATSSPTVDSLVADRTQR